LADWIRQDIEAVASPDTLNHLQLLLGRVERLQMLLDELLAYSQLGQDQSDLHEEFSVTEPVHEIVAVAPSRPGFVVACTNEMPDIIRTHRTALRVVLDNLIGNSLKHHDRAEGRVTVVMRVADGTAEFRVSDDGPGIPPRFHERIFLIFQTLASRDEVEASGMGLAIVKKLVEVHGGRVRIESAPPERGTTFVFSWKADLQ
jgi:signal transduction histidine kinase